MEIVAHITRLPGGVKGKAPGLGHTHAEIKGIIVIILAALLATVILILVIAILHYEQKINLRRLRKKLCGKCKFRCKCRCHKEKKTPFKQQKLAERDEVRAEIEKSVVE